MVSETLNIKEKHKWQRKVETTERKHYFPPGKQSHLIKYFKRKKESRKSDDYI